MRTDASDWKSRRAERNQRRAERNQQLLERHQYRRFRVREEPPAPQVARSQTDVNSGAGENAADSAASEQRAADSADRVTSSPRHKRKARSRTQQPDAVSHDPPREPDYAERRDDGFGFFFAR
jgi:hypothetical protein